MEEEQEQKQPQEITEATPVVIEQIKALLRRPEILDPLLDKAYKNVKMKDPTVPVEDFKLFVKHFCDQCVVPTPQAPYLAEFVGKLKDKANVSQKEFIAFFKEYLNTFVPAQPKKK